MSKQPSIFSFFKKVPSPVVRESSVDNNKSRIEDNFVTPKRKKGVDGFEICDIVWAKLDGYPWWPSLVCQHPKSKKHINGNQLHVQFFDDPPTRAWVNKKRCVEKYSINSDKKNPKGCSDTELVSLKKACEDADKAFHVHHEERENLLVDFSKVPLDDSHEQESSPGTDKENDDGNIDDPPRKKRKLFVFDSDDSEDDYKPGKNEDDEDEEDDDVSSGVDSNAEDNISEVEVEEEEQTPPTKGKRKHPQSSRSTKKLVTPKMTPTSSSRPSFSTDSAKAKLSLFKNSPGPVVKESTKDKSDDWPHIKLDFLQPDKIMDKMKRRPDHPDYDRRTLYVPEEYKAKVTPGVRQWWELKSDHFDCVLFFKVGKFYELYHMDAVIGVNELSLTFMRGEFAHSGFPEIAYGRFSTILIQKGYKVARVEQTETPEMMTERNRQKGRTTKFDKVVKREICQVTTKGTQTFSFIDGEARESETNYLLAITEKSDTSHLSTYGVCFIDSSIGVFRIGQFTDDKYSSRLRTLVSHYPPVQIIYERNHISAKTMQLFKTSLASVLQEPLASDKEFWSASNTLTTLAEEKYFSTEKESGFAWPDAIKAFISEADSLGLSPSDDGELAIKALGACVWYLKQSFLDQQLLAMKKFEIYTPVDSAESPLLDANEDIGRYMVLDGITLTNLEILVNSNGGKAGTLLDKLDRCCTFSGKRLMRQWLCSPLCTLPSIQSRQRAIEELLEKGHVVEEIRALLKKIPDLERLLGKIHAQGNAIRSQTHPDSRAIFFEDKTYSKRKIQDFLSAISGFKKLQEAVEKFQQETDVSSALLAQSTSYSPKGNFPTLTETLKFFEEAFDHELAKKEGCIIPKSSGVDVEYDAIIEELNNIEKDSKEYLKAQCRHFGVQVKYFGTEKNRYQLEIPESQARKTESDYELTSARKGFKRYMTEETKSLLRRQMKAEETKAALLKDLSRRIFAQFSEKYDDWITAIQCMSTFDVLTSLAEYCRTEEGEMCLPEFVPPRADAVPFIDIINGRHPCLTVSDGFIPNDSQLGTETFSSLILLTGPNMGGKSTLMRQIGLIAVMAHMGCRVPATTCRLAPVDRIFTRIGASDDIIAGESTFFVELSETSLILNHATKYSLVLVDELGRGTSTYDGTAIAYSVVHELAERRCRTLFSTHYHSLVEDFKNSKMVSLGHMACMVETDEDDPSEETVTFLYKFSNGACPKSHGFNAAKLAGVPSHIIKVGREKASLLEKEIDRRKLFRNLCGVKSCSSEELAQMIDSIQLLL